MNRGPRIIIGTAREWKGDWAFIALSRAGKGVLIKFNPTTGEEKVLHRVEGTSGRPALSPDGQRVAIGYTKASGGSSGLYLLNSDSGKLEQEMEGPMASHTLFSADGKWIYYTAATTTREYSFGGRVATGGVIVRVSSELGGPVVLDQEYDSIRDLFHLAPSIVGVLGHKKGQTLDHELYRINVDKRLVTLDNLSFPAYEVLRHESQCYIVSHAGHHEYSLYDGKILDSDIERGKQAGASFGYMSSASFDHAKMQVLVAKLNKTSDSAWLLLVKLSGNEKTMSVASEQDIEKWLSGTG